MEQKNYKLMFWKQGIKVIIVLFIIAISIRLSSAATWNQYTPSPTTNYLYDIWSLSNGKAFMIDEFNNYYLFNKSSWKAISPPSTTNYPTFKNCDKTKSEKIY
jgi:hypothetical protein